MLCWICCIQDIEEMGEDTAMGNAGNCKANSGQCRANSDLKLVVGEAWVQDYVAGERYDAIEFPH